MAGPRLIEVPIKSRPQQAVLVTREFVHQLLTIDAYGPEVELIVGGHGKEVRVFTPLQRKHLVLEFTGLGLGQHLQHVFSGVGRFDLHTKDDALLKLFLWCHVEPQVFEMPRQVSPDLVVERVERHDVDQHAARHQG